VKHKKFVTDIRNFSWKETYEMKNSMKRRIQEFLYQSIHEANGDIEKKLNEILESVAQLDSSNASVCELQRQVKEISGQIEALEGSQGKHFEDQQVAALYAYRYLLNREPESSQIIETNERDWQALRHDIMRSVEYNEIRGGGDVYSWQKCIANYIEQTGVTPDYEQMLEHSYRKLISAGDTVVDIGAHVGRHSKVFRDLIGETGYLYLFEPLLEQFAFLAQELAAHNITMFNKALSDHAGTMSFFQVENYPEESGLKKRAYNAKDAIVKQIQVEVETLDHYYDEFNKNGISYIKLDAEGAEVSILKGASECLKQYRPIVSVEYGSPSYSAYGLTADSLYNFTLEYNYYIADLCGNIVLNLDMWREICDSVYWDYFLVPQERTKEFWLKMHS